MSKIVPKLNLNKTPQAVENNSLVYGRNIKLLHDGSIIADTKQDNITPNVRGDIKGHVVGLDNKIYFFTKDDVKPYRNFVCEFDEITKEVKYVNCTWSHSGGKITGCVTINNTGTKILTVCEYGENLHIPVKHIPIQLVNTTGEINDKTDESLYTQSPKIPFLQLNYIGENSAKIRSGVYQFFVRYEISDKIYTKWFPCSKDLYTGDIEFTPTIQGGVSHCDIKKDSFGFDFKIEVLDKYVAKIYKNCQIGCIISTDGASVARIWKTFAINDIIDKTISFSYGSGELEEVDIDEMLASTFDLYNVSNIDVLKNRLYVANYNEDYVYDGALAKHVEDIQKPTEQSPAKLSLSIEQNNIDITKEDINVATRFDVLAQPAHLHYYHSSNNNNDVFLFVNLVEDSNGQTLYNYDEYNKLPSWVSLNAKKHDEFFTRSVIRSTSRLTLQVSDAYDTWPSILQHSCYLIGTFVELVTENNVEYFGLFRKNTSSETVKWIKLDSIEVINSLIYTSVLQGIVAAKYKEGDDFKWVVQCDAFKDTVDKSAWNQVNDKVETNVETLNPEDIEIGRKVDIEGTTGIINKIIFGRLNKDSVENNVTLDKTWFGGIDTYSTFTNDTRFNDLAVLSITIESKSYTSTNSIKIDNTFINTRTLLPSCKYDFYIHFVKEDGIATPGYYLCSQTITTSIWLFSNFIQFYPKIHTNGNIIPDGYKYAFLSVARRKPDVLFVKESDTFDVFYSIDDNALLHTPKDNTTFYQLNRGVLPLKIIGTFVDCYDTENIGCIGVYKRISGTGGGYLYSNDYFDTNTNNEVLESDNVSLIKISPYFGNGGLDNNNNLSLPGFICANVIPSYLLSKTYYAIDTEIYQIDGHKPIEITTPIENKYTPVIYHYSYYNTTLVSANGGLNKNRFKTWVQEVGGKTISTKSIINTINSQEISYFLQLNSTYKDFITPIFNKYNPKQEFNRFDTVVRRSTPYDNENLNFTYRFESGEYYPIPANRGKIVNLVAFADKILLHLEQALLSFDANNLLNTNEQNVALSEGDPFIQGVAFIEDGNYGKAGLVKKEHARLGNNYYIFFDQHENRMYLFDGQNKLQDISISILKLLECVKADDAVFAIDDFGGRFFVNLIKHNDSKQIDKQICLSYSIYGGGFISIHDFSYTTAFNTKNYSYIKKEINLASDPYIRFTNEKVHEDVDGNPYEGAYYPTIFHHSEYLQIDDFDVYNNDAKPASVIDVICNSEYEVIKVLNSISWICNRYKAYDNTESERAGFDKINIAEEERGEFGNKEVELFSATKIRIYSDQTYTPLLTIINNQQDAYGVEKQQMGGYQDPRTSTNEVYPRYNNGVWTLNDFRDIKQFKTAQEGNIDNSLIHGKYIVVRFVFLNANFKLENVIFNMNNYEKV